MRIVIAPDTFKGSLSALEVALAIGRGLKEAIREAEIDAVPMADGGEGTMEALIAATSGRLYRVAVLDPLGREIEAEIGITGDGKTAVVEMARASGLTLLSDEERNPAVTTTYGTGRLIKAALSHSVERIIVAIGGSATNDGGAGMAEALGVRFLSEAGHPIHRGGLGLLSLASIDIGGMISVPEGVQVVVACDVDNPLTGERGASAVYGPQKGADQELVERLDAALSNYSRILQRDLGIKVDDVKGAGAAGGLGAGLMAFLNARLQPGAALVAEACRLKERMAGADLVITGEGRLDGQTLHGKAPMGVAEAAGDLGIPVIAVGGGVLEESDALYSNGFDGIIGICERPMDLAEAMAGSERLLERTGYRLGRLLRVGSKALCS